MFIKFCINFTIWTDTNKILVFNTCAQKPHLNAHADITSGARDLNFDLSLHLHPYFVYASSKGSGESA